MKRLYRLQQHLAITGPECTALTVVSVLFALGVSIRFFESRPAPFPADIYAETDSLFEQGSHALPSLVPAAPATDTSSVIPDAPVARLNLNTATAVELEGLPRIGPQLAARIIAYRDARGGFREVRELTAVNGIGEKTLARLLPFLYVDPP